MILRHEDVRQAAKAWQTFSSDAPFRVPIPSEEAVRSTRQLPIETNPPEHGDYRGIIEPFFARAKEPAVIAQVEALIDGLLTSALPRDAVEIVNESNFPLQSRALTSLLNVPVSEAEIWIGWGIHVFKVTGGEFKTGNVLEDYLHRKFDEPAFPATHEVRLDRKPNPHLSFGFGPPPVSRCPPRPSHSSHAPPSLPRSPAEHHDPPHHQTRGTRSHVRTHPRQRRADRKTDAALTLAGPKHSQSENFPQMIF